MVPVVDRNEVHCERSASRRDGVTPGKCFGRWRHPGGSPIYVKSENTHTALFRRSDVGE